MPPTSPTLRKIARGQLCAGCGGCAALAPDAIQMGYDRPGYLRPIQTASLTREQEKDIAALCPGLGLRQNSTAQDHTLWGPIVAARIGYAADDNLRRNASSGGGLSAVLVHLLASGRVDRVVQTTAAPDLPTGNASIITVNPDEIFAAAGSRYAPSAPLAGLERWLDGTERLAFVGKPCDVAAMRNWARLDSRVSQRFPIMVSFFCAGIPSLTGSLKVLAALGVDPALVTRFRYRGDGWPGLATATLRDGTSKSMTYAESWGGILSKHVQLRCKICPDGTGGFADIVCADAWETDPQGYPIFEEQDGQSLILSRTSVGEEIIAEALAAERLHATDFNLKTLRAMQPGQVRKRQLTLPRLLALWVTFRPVPRFRGFHLMHNMRQAGTAAPVRNFLGMLRRVLQGRTDGS